MDTLETLKQLGTIFSQTNRTFYHWKYDDGKEAGILLDENYFAGDEVGYTILASKLFDNRQARKKFFSQIKTRAKSEKILVTSEPHSLCAGLSSFRTEPDEKVESDCLEEFLRMINSCGPENTSRAEVLKLVSGILTGYTAKLFAEYDIPECPLHQQRPLLVLMPYGQNLWEILFAFVNSLTISSDRQKNAYGPPICQITPIALPPKQGKKHDISADAKICFHGKQKPRSLGLPAQYRETAVIINAATYPSNQLKDFFYRNRWASIVLYSSKAGKDTDSMATPIMLQPKTFLKCNPNWDMKTVSLFIRQFLIWLARSHEVSKTKHSHKLHLRKCWRNAQSAYVQYTAQKGAKRLSPSLQYQVCLQLATLRLLLNFANEKLDCNTEQHMGEWANLLLPGSYTLPANDLPLAQRINITEADFQEIFESILRQMLTIENLHRILPVPEKGLFDRINPDDTSICYWGYVRNYKSKKDPPFLALQFEEKSFCQFASDFLAYPVDLKEIIKCLRKRRLPYLHENSKARMPENNEDKNLYSCITLRVDDLVFLDENIRDALKKSLNPES